MPVQVMAAITFWPIFKWCFKLVGWTLLFTGLAYIIMAQVVAEC